MLSCTSTCYTPLSSWPVLHPASSLDQAMISGSSAFCMTSENPSVSTSACIIFHLTIWHRTVCPPDTIVNGSKMIHLGYFLFMTRIKRPHPNQMVKCSPLLNFIQLEILPEIIAFIYLLHTHHYGSIFQHGAYKYSCFL